jgi:hypothetical protein
MSKFGRISIAGLSTANANSNTDNLGNGIIIQVDARLSSLRESAGFCAEKD